MNTPPAIVARQLTAVARHLSTHRPDARMTDAARTTVAVIAASGRTQAVRPLLKALPFPTGDITRAEYALRIRKTAWALGHPSETTTPDPNWAPGPVVPHIPGQRYAMAGGTR